MKKWYVEVTPEFGAELRSIHSYISNILKEPIIANKMIEQILNVIKNLSYFPLRNPLYINSDDIRKITTKKYVIFYKVDDTNSTVSVLHIFYGAINIEKQLQN